MALVTGTIEDFGRGTSSPRPRARDNTKNILCKNIGLYGHCRYEDKGCAYSHSPPQPESMKKQFNVDSPSFVPASLAVNGHSPAAKSSGLSPKAANAAPFKPRGTVPAPTAPIFTPAAKKYNPNAPDWVAPESQELIPPTFPTISNSGNESSQGSFDQYTAHTPSLPSGSHTPQPQVNPYAQETGPIGGSGYYPGSSGYQQPLQHHLYADLGPHREHLQANQRTARDFFIPEDLRQMLQKKNDATLATFPNSTLPPSIAHYHGFVPLVHNSQKNTTMFGYSSWTYKAMSSQDGKAYGLRRLQGFHLTDESTERAIRSVAENWSRVRNANVVTVYLAFTNSGFGDSSLFFVTDFHPLAETLAQKHFTSPSRYPYRSPEKVTEQTLWSYIVQITSALKAIHSVGLAARVIDPSKVLLTSENHIRLNGCAVMDVVNHNTEHTIDDLQCLDLYQLGQLIVSIATNNSSASHGFTKAFDNFSRSYSARLRDRVSWLLNHQHPQNNNEGIDVFIASIAPDIISHLDSAFHHSDRLETNLGRELENSRIARLMVKLNFLNERPEHENDRAWSEQGNRYILQLFRDYVFHQVDSHGKPVLDLAHVLSCLNKVDAGIDEKITLTARDENTVIIVTYREVRTAIEAAYGDLMRRAV